MFEYFVSLGNACQVASSMSKYGLRSFSGPFDWLVTNDFAWVLHYMETDFRDFLLSENLERYDENPNHFCDKQSKVLFIHERDNFEKEYNRLKAKYDRRINRFIEKRKHKVCYLRFITGQEELVYIENNENDIEAVIRKYNRDSEIIFLYNADLQMRDGFEITNHCYKIPWIFNGASHFTLRACFDHADDFLFFCGKNYSAANLLKNLSVDLEKEEPSRQLTERRYKTLTTLLAHDFSRDMKADKVIIYGAGAIGKALYEKIQNDVLVECFVDQQKAGYKIGDIKVISIDELRYIDKAKVIVSATYDFDNIKKKLNDFFRDEDIISLDEILNLEFY